MISGPAASQRRDCPYFGLDYYDELWGDWFFGRDPECDRIITNLRGARLTLLHADSGVGKSSLLRAGVAARLAATADRSLARRGRARFSPVVFSAWKDDPVTELIEAIAAAITCFTPDGSVPELPRDSLADAITVATAAIDGTLLLILDQFEEYFLYTAAEPTPGRLADELSRVINDNELPAHVLISIREDAYAGLGDLFKGRLANVYGNYLDVAYLDRASAAEAIRRPLLEVYNAQPGVEPVEIEPQLVDAVLDQVRAGGEPVSGQSPAAGGNGVGNGHVATPLLALVMEAIWRQERSEGSRILRLATLERLEGVEHILDAHLASALGALTEEQRDVALAAFDHLVTPSGGKIAESIPDLAARTSQTEARLGEVLTALDHARILRPVPAPPGRDPARFRRYEIFHDVLAPAINRAIATRTAERLERERNDAVDRVRLERRRVRRAQLLAVIACLFAIVAAVGVVYALHQRQHAIDDQHSAQSAEGAASAEQLLSSDPGLAAAVALRALQLHRGPAAEAALRAAVPLLQLRRTLTLPAPADAVAYSPDGKTIAVTSSDGTIELWNATTSRLEASFGAEGKANLESMAFGAGGRLIATGYEDGIVRIWSVARRRELGAPLLVDPGFLVTSVGFNPSGTELAVAESRRVRIFDVASHTQRRVLSNPDGSLIHDVTWGPVGGEVLAATDTGNAYLWNAASGALLATLPGVDGRLNSAQFSHDGDRIVTASADRTVEIWDARTHRPLYRLRSPYGVFDATFSPDGRSVATVGDGPIGIWNADVSADQPSDVFRRAGVPATGLTAAYSPDGGSLAVAGADGLVRIWNTHSAKQRAVLGGGGANPITSVAYSADGRWLVAGSTAGSARIWNASTGAVRLTVALPNPEQIDAVAMRPDGQQFLTADAGGLGTEWAAGSASVTSAVVDPTGRALNAIEYDPINSAYALTASADDVRIWDLDSERSVPRIPRSTLLDINGAAFSDNGQTFVTYTPVGTATVWSVRSGRPVGREILEPHGGTITDATFDRSGNLVVTVSGDGTARVWNVSTGQETGQPLTEPGNAFMSSAEFAATGDRVLTSSSDGAARIWDWQTGRQQLTLVGNGGSDADAALSPNGDEVATGGGDGTVRIWDAQPTQQVGAGIYARNGSDLYTSFFNPQGTRVVTASNTGYAQVWSVDDQRRSQLTLHEPDGAALTSAVFDPSGTHILTASVDGTARIWDASTGAMQKVFRVPGTPTVDSAVYSPDGSRVVVSTQNAPSRPGFAVVYDVRTGRRIGQAIADPSYQSLSWAAFSADGSQIVTSDYGGSAYLWRATPGSDGVYAEIGAPLTEPGGQPLTDAWFDPNPGSPLVVTASSDGTARVWNRNTGTQVGLVAEPGHSPIYNAVLGPHGWLLTASGDGEVRIWNWLSGQQLTEFTVGDQVSDAQFSPNGRLVATASYGGAGPIFSTALAGPTSTVQSIARRLDPMRLTAAQARAYLR